MRGERKRETYKQTDRQTERVIHVQETFILTQMYTMYTIYIYTHMHTHPLSTYTLKISKNIRKNIQKLIYFEKNLFRKRFADLYITKKAIVLPNK